MTANPTPDDPEWVRGLVRRSPLVPEPGLRRHWERIIPVLEPPERYALAAILLDIEHACHA